MTARRSARRLGACCSHGPVGLEPFLLWLLQLGQSTVGLLLVSASIAVAAPCARAGAQVAPTADALFEEGRLLMNAGRHADACPKFEASHRLDPAIGTLLNLGYCYAEIGKIASAWTAYREAASLATWQRQPEREAFARAQAAALEPRIARLTVRVAEPAHPGLEVKRGGSPIPRDAWGSALPVDPGEWTIEATAPGRERFEVRVSVAPAGTAEITVPDLALSTAAAPEAAAPPEEPPAPSDAEPAKVAGPAGATAAPARGAAPGGDSVLPMIGLGVGAAGLVGLGLSAVFAVEMRSEDDVARGICADPDGPCSEEDAQHWDEVTRSAKKYQTLAYVTAGVGAACVITGVALFLIGSDQSGDPPALSVDVSPSALALRLHGAIE